MSQIILGGQLGSTRIGAYRYGEKKWDDYLVDIRKGVQSGSNQICREIERSGARGVAASEQSNQLRQESIWALEAINAEMSMQTDILRRIDGNLSQIAQALMSPYATSARELCTRGFKSLAQEWFSEAELDLKQAIEKDPTSCFAHYGLGYIYLFGASTSLDRIDLSLAQNFMEKAHKFARGLPDGIRSIAHEGSGLGLAKILFCRSSDAALQSDSEAATKYLRDAVKVLENCSNAETRYLLAKCYAVMGDVERASVHLAQAADADPAYLDRAAKDTDLKSLGAVIMSGIKRRLAAGEFEQTGNAKVAVERAKKAIEILKGCSAEVQLTERSLWHSSQHLTILTNSDTKPSLRIRVANESLESVRDYLNSTLQRLTHLEETERIHQRGYELESEDPSMFLCVFGCFLWTIFGIVYAAAVFAIGGIASFLILYFPISWIGLGSGKAPEWSAIALGGLFAAFAFLWSIGNAMTPIAKRRAAFRRMDVCAKKAAALGVGNQKIRAALKSL